MDSKSVQSPHSETPYAWLANGTIPFLLAHVVALFALQYPLTPWLLFATVGSYVVRMFAVTAGYHRYFSHRTYKTSRVFQFVLAWLAQSSAQKGVLWWAAHHRHHHKYSDLPEDLHSPKQSGFWWSHVGWILSARFNRTRLELIRDFARYPELLWLNTYHYVPPLVGGIALWLIGGAPLFLWAGLVATVFLWHGTFFINSLAHVIGRRRYETTDTSKNSLILAIVTLGEGWHNNHHFHHTTANQGWFWWEIDVTYYVLWTLSRLGIVWDLKLPSEATKYAHLRGAGAQSARTDAVPSTAAA